MKKREIQLKNKLFQLIRQQRDHKTWYEIHATLPWDSWKGNLEEEITSYFGSKTSKYSNSWRFWNREEALKQFTYISFRWL